MTFIWAEITLLQLWWDQAHPTKQRALKHLIKSGRFEIVTGGWVSTKINCKLHFPLCLCYDDDDDEVAYLYFFELIWHPI